MNMDPLSGQYSGKENVHLEESIDDHILDLVKLIEDKYLSDGSSLRPIDFARKAQFLTLDIITDIAFGETFGDLKADEDLHDYLAIVERMLPTSRWLILFPSLMNLVAIQWIGRWVLPSSEDGVGVGKVMGFVVIPLCLLAYLAGNTCTNSEYPVGLQRERSPRDMDRIQRPKEICWVASFDMVSLKKRPSRKVFFKCIGDPWRFST